MPYADVNGARLFYTDDGEGPPILLVHGYTCDSQDWIYQISALLQSHRVIAVDLRGHGHSSSPPDGYTPRGYADDLNALLTQLGTGPVVAIGHSMGGATVVALAVEHPESVRAVVPIDSAYGMDPAAPEQFGPLIEGLASPGGHEVARQFFLAGFYSDATPPQLPVWHGRRIFAVEPHVLAAAVAGMVLAEDQFATMPESEAYLARVACPALAFRAGRQDPSTVAAWELAQFKHPYSRAIGWEGNGHFLHQERPEEFNRIVLEWIAGLP